ncbi:MAG TPA: sensor histidine kinase [Candidatus Limnocylindrales bacterium]|nr:sensor histidine kinase [Candidatus Limnocylindrales bacterium]
MTTMPGSVIERLRANPLAVDVFIALGLTALSLVTVAGGAQDFGSYDPLSLGLLLLQTLPLIARRRWPLAVMAVVFTATTIHAFLAPASISTTLGFLVALYTVGEQLDRRTSGTAAILGAILVGSVITIRGTLPAALSSLVQTELIVFSTWVLGTWARDRRLQLETVEERAVAEERARIARELHDVVTHHVSVIVIQAGAAERALDRRPADVRTAIEAIDATARQALADMRRMLGILGRGTASGSELAPMPSLDRLGELLEQVRSAGTPVELSVTGDRRRLDPGVELSAYRIIQEALTNAMRHAPGSRARVSVGYGRTALEIQVDDDGPNLASDADRRLATPGSGHGIIGMRERVAVFGGDFEAHPTEHGFRVAARLPLGGTAG